MPINCAINFQCAATITESGSPKKLRMPPPDGSSRCAIVATLATAAVNFRLDGRLLRKEVPHYHDSNGMPPAATDIDRASATRTFGGDPAQPVTTFTLIAPETDRQPIDALPVGPRAALLKLPEDALAFTGQFVVVGEGTLALIAPGRAMGFGIVRLDGLLQASSPVAIDWDLATGELPPNTAPPSTPWAPDATTARSSSSIAPADANYGASPPSSHRR